MESVSSHPARRWSVLAVAAVLGLTMVFATTSASSASPGHAVAAKKRCKKKHSRAAAAKKCKKKKSAPAPVVTPPPPPAPLALTDAEVINRVTQKAQEYCAVDSFCYDYGYYYDSNPSEAYCTSKSTYSWSCLGYNLEDFGTEFDACDFREIVERVGYNGITSHQDLTYGSGGWDCYEIV
jgi:hypothetical protein